MDSTYCRVLDRPSSSCELSALYCILITFLERTVLSSPCSSTDYSTHASSTASNLTHRHAAKKVLWYHSRSTCSYCVYGLRGQTAHTVMNEI
jgi:L-lysine 2,3-aminomutase